MSAELFFLVLFSSGVSYFEIEMRPSAGLADEKWLSLSDSATQKNLSYQRLVTI